MYYQVDYDKTMTHIITIPAVNTAMGTGGSSEVSLFPLFICLVIFFVVMIAVEDPVQKAHGLLPWSLMILLTVVVGLSLGY